MSPAYCCHAFISNYLHCQENNYLEHHLHEAHHQLSALAQEHTELQQRHQTVNIDYDEERKVSSQVSRLWEESQFSGE